MALILLSAGPSAPGAGHLPADGELQAPECYQIQIVAHGLNFATAVDVADDGTVYIAEAGYAYGYMRQSPLALGQISIKTGSHLDLRPRPVLV